MNKVTRACTAVGAAMLATGACNGDQQLAPAGFTPARKIERLGGRIARCNTVHSLTLPETVIERYGLSAGRETGIISCSLQVTAESAQGGLPVNVRALLTGTATTLTGKRRELDFKEVLERGAVTYVATFPLVAASRIDFVVWLYDPISGRRFKVEFQQVGLPGRR